MLLFFYVIWMLVNITLQLGTQEYGMDEDSCRNGIIFLDSAIVRSQANDKYYKHGLECTMKFQGTGRRLLIQVQLMDIYKGYYGNCSEDYFSIVSLADDDQEIVLVDRMCGSLADLPKKTFELLDKVAIKWLTSANSTAQKSHVGFKLLLTSFSDSKDSKCNSGDFLCPLNGRCIPKSLVGDGFVHCEDECDENPACSQPTTTPSFVQTTNNASEVTESETFWFISMLGIIVISIIGAIIAVIRRKHIEQRDRSLNARIAASNNEEAEDEQFGYNRQESVLSTGSASNNVEPPPEYDTALTCSSDPLPPSYSEVDFESITDNNGNRTTTLQPPESPFFTMGDVSPGANSVFILDTVNEDDKESVELAINNRTNPRGVRVYIPSESTVSEEDESARL